MSVIAVYREPFAVVAAPTVRRMPGGMSLAAMAGSMRGLPEDFETRGTICINGHAAPRALWGAIKPKPAANGVPIEVSFHMAAAGGGGDDGGGKNVFATIASIALMVATGFVAGGGLSTSLGWGAFAKGSMGAYLAAAGVSYVGSLLIASLSPTPTTSDGDSVDNLKDASASGNVLSANAPIPRVAGTRKIYPPLMCEPYTYFDGQDEIVEAVYALSGPHDLTDIRINDAPLFELADVSYETREGWRGDAPLSLIERFARTESVRSELSAHSVSEEDGAILEVGTDGVAASLPQERTVVTKYDPDEHQLQIAFPAGINKSAGDDTYRVPLRIAMRKIGATAWINLPELHYQAASQRGLRATVRLIWTDTPSAEPAAASTEGWVEARAVSLGQTVAPVGDARSADGYFYLGSGDTFMDSTNAVASGVQHTVLSHYEALIYLDTAIFDPAMWEIKVQRGYAFKAASYTASNYQLSGAVRNFFSFENETTPQIKQSRDGLSDTIYLMRSVSIWNAHPAPSDDCAYIAIRARNRSMDSVSVVASGYVKDWDGAHWANWTITPNPAPHLRDVIAGSLAAKSIPDDVVDDAELVAWRADCDLRGLTVSALIEDKSMGDAAAIIASCGYARLRQSETWGVVRDYDRSAETPVQIFTPRNASGLSWSKAFSDVPDAFLVTYADADLDYDDRQLTIWREGAMGQLMEQVSYEGVVHESDVRLRAQYDFDTAVYRSAFYTLDAPAEAIRCRRGSLVGVQHDMLTDRAGQGRVIGWALNDAGQITGVQLDDAVPVSNSLYLDEVANLAEEPNLASLGKKTGVVLRRTDGTFTSHAVENEGGLTDILDFADATNADGIDVDILATVGALSQEYGRFIVYDMTPKDDLTFSLTLVDEASELFAA